MTDVNPETITNTPSWYKIRPLNGFNLIRAKHYPYMRLEKSWSRRTDRKFYTQTTRWNLGKHVKNYHGITALQHFIDPRQMASLKEPFDESKKAHQQYCYSQDWMKGGSLTLLTLWNAIAICETSKTSCPTGRRHVKDDSENQSKDQQFLLEQWLNIILLHQKIWQESITRNLLGYELIAGGIWKGDVLIADLEDLEKLDASDFSPRRVNAKEVFIDQTKR